MKASFYIGERNFELREVPIPSIGSDEILIKMRACGICGTDVHKAIHGTVVPSTVLGHEVAGTVVEIGEEVNKFSVGDHVAVAHHAPCMVCLACLKGHHSLCSQYLQTNIVPGGFSEYIRLPRENVQKTVYKFPFEVNFEAAAFMEPLACCLRGFDRGNFRTSDNVLILGAGPIGLLHLQIALLGQSAYYLHQFCGIQAAHKTNRLPNTRSPHTTEPSYEVQGNQPVSHHLQRPMPHNLNYELPN